LPKIALPAHGEEISISENKEASLPRLSVGLMGKGKGGKRHNLRRGKYRDEHHGKGEIYAKGEDVVSIVETIRTARGGRKGMCDAHWYGVIGKGGEGCFTGKKKLTS